jgi:hypothetical protein
LAAIGHHHDLLTVQLDVTRAEDAEAAVAAAIAKFGRIDVLVNNAGNFYAGFFEELTPEQVRHQIEAPLFGPMNVSRAVLPVMRRQRAGLLLTISSTAGLTGSSFCSAYSAARQGCHRRLRQANPGDRRRLEQHGRQAEGRPRKARRRSCAPRRPKDPPARFAAGADALQTLETKANTLLVQANAYRELSSFLAHLEG